VSDKEIRSWLHKKLDEGVEPERLRKILRKKGYDPDIVNNISKNKKKHRDSSDQENKDLIHDLGSEIDEKGNVEDKFLDSAAITESTERPGQQTNQGKSSQGTKFDFRKEAEHLEQIAANLKENAKNARSGWRHGAKIMALSAFLILGAIFANSTLAQQHVQDFADHIENSNVGESENQKAESNSLQTNETTMVTLENGFAKPSRPTVSPGDKAVFVNKHNHSLRLEFESSRKGFNLGSRKTKAVEFSSIDYYTAILDDQKETEIKGSINVQ
jgi:plastocyanin